MTTPRYYRIETTTGRDYHVSADKVDFGLDEVILYKDNLPVFLMNASRIILVCDAAVYSTESTLLRNN